jgi:hypothetical protein
MMNKKNAGVHKKEELVIRQSPDVYLICFYCTAEKILSAFVTSSCCDLVQPYLGVGASVEMGD